MKRLFLKRKQLLLFVVAGAMSAVIEVGTFKIFSVYLPKIFSWEKNWLGISYPLSNISSTGSGIISNYFFSIWFVFSRGKHSKKREFIYFMMISVFSTILSLIFFQIFYSSIFKNEYFDLFFFVFSAEMLSKISAIALVSVLNYIVKKNMVFNS